MTRPLLIARGTRMLAAVLFVAAACVHAEPLTTPAAPSLDTKAAEPGQPPATARSSRSSFIVRNGKIEEVRPSTKPVIVTPDDALKCR